MPVLAREGLEPRRLALLARRLRRADAAIEATTDAAVLRLTVSAAPVPSLRELQDLQELERAGPAPAFPPRPPDGPIEFDREGFARLPEEIALRLIGRALTRVGDEGPVELKKLEGLTSALRLALAERGTSASFRRTLAGGLVSLGRRLRVERAPPRRRR
jgi:tRNA(Ile)-lysidine synthase